MNTKTLEHVLQKISKRHLKRYGEKLQTAVYASDQLPSDFLRKFNGISTAIIVNTDPSYKPGQHWQAMYITKTFDDFNPTVCQFFDSYGQTPIDKIRDFVDSFSLTFYQNKQLQGLHSTLCGEWCCMFLWTLASGKAAQDLFAEFSHDYEKNDKQIQKKFKLTFCSKLRNGCIQSCCSKNNHIK